MKYSDKNRADDIAAQIALTELVRLAISELCYSDDANEFRRRARVFEEAAVKSISSRRHFEQANEATENYIKESASHFVTRVMSSIRHPEDAGDTNA